GQTSANVSSATRPAAYSCPNTDVYFGQMSRRPALELKTQIRNRIVSQTGAVWTPVDFLDFDPQAAVDKTLQRFVQNGENLTNRPRPVFPATETCPDWQAGAS